MGSWPEGGFVVWTVGQKYSHLAAGPATGGVFVFLVRTFFGTPGSV